ncbi:MAG: hypothetical protein ABH879_07460 [archaeon]
MGLTLWNIADRVRDSDPYTGIWSPEDVPHKQELVAKLISLYPNHFKDRNLTVLQAPGRAEVGHINHGDYCGLETIVMPINRGVIAVFAPNDEGVVRVASDGFGLAELPFSDAATGTGWENYLATTVRRAAINFPGELRGFDMAMVSDLSNNGGMSSSSAVMITYFLATMITNGLETHPAFAENIKGLGDLILYTGAMECGNDFRTLAGETGVGTKGGSQDHAVILAGEQGYLTGFVTCPEVKRVRRMAFPEDLAIIVAETGAEANKTGDAQTPYNDVAGRAGRTLEAVNDEFGGPAAQTVAEMISRAGAYLDYMINAVGGDAERIRHCVEMKGQLPFFVRAMEGRDYKFAGELMTRAHHLSGDCLGNTTPEMTRVIYQAIREGAYGGVVNGAGFGGTVTILAPADKAVRIADGMPGSFVVPKPAAGVSTMFTKRGVSSYIRVG